MTFAEFSHSIRAGLVVVALVLLGAAPSAHAINKQFNWVPPTLNADGTTLSDLAGYELSWGASPGNYSTVRNVGNVSTVIIDFPTAGLYYASVRALDLSGNRSVYSNEVSFS